MYYIPELVYNGLFSFALLTIMLWLVFSLLFWDVTWIGLGRILETPWMIDMIWKLLVRDPKPES